MDSDDKSDSYHNFKEGEITILCATSAFGMGMNIRDIDMVIHHRLPDSIEEFYQQVGRAARDKRICPVANCFALWSEVNIQYKLDEFIPSVELSLDQIIYTFKSMGLQDQAGEPQSMKYSDYIKQRLGRIRYALEKRNIIKTIGEVNGSPKSILFNEDNPHWNAMVTKMGFGNSFVRMATKSELDLQELIDYVFEKELNGEIKKFPALEKKIFFISDFDNVPVGVAFDIIEESQHLANFKKIQIEKLAEMISSNDPETYIELYFQAQ